MFDEPKRDLLRKITQDDAIASGLRTTLGLLGPFGVITGEFLTQFVPQQRIDRLRDFVEQLDVRLKGLEEQFKERLHHSPAYASLFEESNLSAIRSANPERRRDLASLLKTGLQWADAELLEHHTMIRLLERVNEAQILILMGHGNFSGGFGDKALEAFHNAHPGVFAVEPPHRRGSEEDDHRWAIHSHQVDELLALGLLKDTEGVAKSGAIRRVDITTLGRMLLEAIERRGTDAAS